MNLSRRRFLFIGVAGTVTLVAARWLTPAMAMGVGELPGLSPAAADIMRALVPAFLDGALPTQAQERAAATEQTIAGVAAAIAGLPPSARDELATLFALLAFAPIRFAFAGIDGSWRDATRVQANAFLERLRKSRWALKRSAYDALHQLTLAAWYADPASWPSIGYPGPPRLS